MSLVTASPRVEVSDAKDRSGFLSVLKRHISSGKVGTSGRLLVLGAGEQDASVLRQAGWSAITLSNFRAENANTIRGDDYLELDAENLALPDESFESVAAYEVLHHCRSPHRALCEMLRVSRRYVFFQEPNDSALYALFRRIGLISAFEIPAVVANGFVAGGVRNTAVPNHIYRWNHRTVYQTALSFIPDSVVYVHSYPYWELNQTEFELSLRLESRIGYLIKAAGGPGNFRRILRVAQRVLNAMPPCRRTGNQFFCCIEKTNRLHEWLLRQGNQTVFNRQYR
jgi:SAM-dependent methyltransferase